MFSKELKGSLKAWLGNIVLSPLQEEYSSNAVLSNAVKMFVSIKNFVSYFGGFFKTLCDLVK